MTEQAAFLRARAMPQNLKDITVDLDAAQGRGARRRAAAACESVAEPRMARAAERSSEAERRMREASGRRRAMSSYPTRSGGEAEGIER